MSLHTAIGVGASEVLSNECTVAQGLAAVRRLGAKCRGLIHELRGRGLLRGSRTYAACSFSGRTTITGQ